jgi:hypothetical protein
MTTASGYAGDPLPDLSVTSEVPTGDSRLDLLFGPGLVIGINTALLAFQMYRSQLVPRPIAVLGPIGGPLVFPFSMAVLFGAYEQTSAVAGLAAIPVFGWEMSLAGWIIAKGFKLDRARHPLDLSPGIATASSHWRLARRPCAARLSASSDRGAAPVRERVDPGDAAIQAHRLGPHHALPLGLTI